MSLGPDRDLGPVWPAPEVFAELARQRRVIPVVKRLLADAETPVGLYRKLAADRPGTYLLESAEHGGLWSRYSFIGVRSGATLTERDGQAVWIGPPPAGVPTTGRAVDVLDATLSTLRTDRLSGLPPFTGGMVGVVGYDAVRSWERVGRHAVDELGLPALTMCLATDLAVLDHSDGTLLLIANAVNHDATDERVEEAYADAVSRLDAMTRALSAPAPSTVAVTSRVERPHARHRTSRQEYLASVGAALQAIRDGEVFQVVLGQRFDLDCTADALDVYRCLRTTNPSPYMYLFRCQGPDGLRFDVVGSSPEALVKAEAGQVFSHPIAGTRPRGDTPEKDALLAQDLLGDVKERSEHLMLVDLARNDLNHVCEAGTVEVVDFMGVEKYSHVIHLVSTVTGRQKATVSAMDVLAATFPAGTLSGAPKPRALELIDELEPTRRGVYGGAVGYLDFCGDLDLAIAIRTAVIRDGVAHVGAGAGIVAESVPETEYAECQHKAAAVLTAVAAAGTLRPADR